MINSSIKVVLSVLWVKNPQLFKFLSQNLSIIENLIFSNEILTIFTQCVRESYLKLAGLVIKWKLFKMHATKYSGPKIFNSESSQFFFIWQVFHSINHSLSKRGKAKCLIGVIFDSVGMNHLVGFFKIFITKNYLERTDHIF